MSETEKCNPKAIANKMAALALALSDEVLADTDDLSPSAIVALLAASEADEMSIGAIADVVGLTHSAAVRLVDRMEKDWLMRRQRRIGREVLVEVTSRGRRKAKALAEARLVATSSYLSVLSDDELKTFNGLLHRIVAHQKGRTPQGSRFCRACEHKACDCGAAG